MWFNDFTQGVRLILASILGLTLIVLFSSSASASLVHRRHAGRKKSNVRKVKEFYLSHKYKYAI